MYPLSLSLSHYSLPRPILVWPSLLLMLSSLLSLTPPPPPPHSIDVIHRYKSINTFNSWSEKKKYIKLFSFKRMNENEMKIKTKATTTTTAEKWKRIQCARVCSTPNTIYLHICRSYELRLRQTNLHSVHYSDALWMDWRERVRAWYTPKGESLVRVQCEQLTNCPWQLIYTQIDRQTAMDRSYSAISSACVWARAGSLCIHKSVGHWNILLLIIFYLIYSRRTASDFEPVDSIDARRPIIKLIPIRLKNKCVQTLERDN